MKSPLPRQEEFKIIFKSWQEFFNIFQGGFPCAEGRRARVDNSSSSQVCPAAPGWAQSPGVSLALFIRDPCACKKWLLWRVRAGKSRDSVSGTGWAEHGWVCFQLCVSRLEWVVVASEAALAALDFAHLINLLWPFKSHSDPWTEAHRGQVLTEWALPGWFSSHTRVMLWKSLEPPPKPQHCHTQPKSSALAAWMECSWVLGLFLVFPGFFYTCSWWHFV